MRVVLAEDSVLLRQGLVALLTEHPAVAEVIEAGDLGELLSAVSEQEPDVVLADIRMPPTHTDEGIRAAERFRRTHPQAGGGRALPARRRRGSAGPGGRRQHRSRLPAQGAGLRRRAPRLGARGRAPRRERHRPARRRRPDAAPPALRGQPGRAPHQPGARGARPDRHRARRTRRSPRRCTSPPARSRSTSTRSSPSSTCPPATAPTVGSRRCCSTWATAGPPLGRWRPGRWSEVDRARVGFAGRGGRLASREARMRAYLRVNLLAIWFVRARPGDPAPRARPVAAPSSATSSRWWRAASCSWPPSCWPRSEPQRPRRGRSPSSRRGSSPLAITWVGPFLAPVGLLALLLPLVIVADHLVPRLRTPAIVMTVVLSGVVAAIGVSRWPAYEATHPVTLHTVARRGALRAAARQRARRGPARLRHPARATAPTSSRSRAPASRWRPSRPAARSSATCTTGPSSASPRIAVNLGRVTRLWDQDPPQARTIVHGLQDQLEAAIRDLRDLAHGIYPPHPRRARPGRGPAGGGPPHRPAVHGRRAGAGSALALGRGGGLLLLHRGDPQRRPALRGARSSRCRPPTTRDPAVACGSASPTTATVSTPPRCDRRTG